MQPQEGGQLDDGFHAGIADMGAAEAELNKVGKLLEYGQAVIGNRRLRQVENLQALDFRDFCKGFVVYFLSANAEMFERRQAAKRCDSRSRELVVRMVEEQHAKMLHIAE